jgi:DNA-directed RNA polymerase subunit RPC12/RpoP
MFQKSDRAILEGIEEALDFMAETPESTCQRCGGQMTRITVGMVYRCKNCHPESFRRTKQRDT